MNDLISWKLRWAVWLTKLGQTGVGFAWRRLTSVKPRSIFDLLDKLPSVVWPHRIIKPLDGMLAPLTLCKGNIHDAAEDWPRVINDYEKRAIQRKKAFLVCHDTLWQMWGPSWEHHLNNEKFEIYQFGFGDENNSLPIVLSIELIKCHNFSRCLVMPIQTTGTLISASDPRLRKLFEGIEGSDERLKELSARFRVVLVAGKEANARLFGDEKMEDPKFLAKKKTDFYSAYIWCKLRHRKLGDFCMFEHGNIADSCLVEMYTDLLAVKINYMAGLYGRENLTVQEVFLERMKPAIKANGAVQVSWQ